MLPDPDFDYLAWETLTASMPDHYLGRAKEYIYGVPEARRREQVASQAQAALVTDLIDAGTITGADAATHTDMPADINDVPAWANPGTDQTRMYRRGQIVTHNGHIWESQVDGLNSWEPGGDGVHYFIWADVTDMYRPTDVEGGGDAPGGDTPAEDGSKERPFAFRAGLAVTPGQYIRYQDSLYEVLQAHTTQDDWTPPAVASLYRKV